MTYLYTTKRQGNVIMGIVKADNPFKAVFSARDEAFIRGADVKALLINKI